VLKERSTYEIIDAASGPGGRPDHLGKHTGRHAFADITCESSHRGPGRRLERSVRPFQELADRKVQLTEIDLEAIVAEELGTALEEGFTLDVLDVQAARIGCRAPGSW